MESRRAGPWQVMFNPIRALRPPRISGQQFDGLLRPFDPAGFHFNKPFLAKEILWEGELAGKPARLLYNKFPFARLHGLLVPEPLRELPQYLTPELHGWAWDLCAQSGVPGLCLGYNSYGAGASVNHLHFQSFVQTEPAAGAGPALCPQRRHRALSAALPALHRSRRRLARARPPAPAATPPTTSSTARDCLHLIARVPQDSGKLSAQSRGYGWSEMAGAVTLFSRETFEGLSAGAFEAELARFAL